MPTRARTGIYPGRVDQATSALVAIDYEHKEVHSGDSYFVTYTESIDSTETINIFFDVPSVTKKLHMEWLTEAQANCLVELVENVTNVFEEVVTLQPRNRNRNFNDTDSIMDTRIYSSGGLDGTGGTVIWKWSAGGAAANPNAGRSPTVNRSLNEIVFKPGFIYEFRITSNVDDNVISVYMTWYEHADVE